MTEDDRRVVVAVSRRVAWLAFGVSLLSLGVSLLERFN